MAYVLIVAAGKGERSGLDIPKQFYEIDGKPVLYYTVRAFLDSGMAEHIAVALPDENFEAHAEYMKRYLNSPEITYIRGGGSRMESVYKGLIALERLQTDNIVIVHDGVRMFVTAEIIADSIRCAKEYGAALTAVGITDTVKLVENGTVRATLDRDKLFAAQTPQAFKLDMIVAAYKKAMADGKMFTDDCAVAEYSGITVHIAKGSVKNIKLTVKEDFEKL